MRRRFFLFAAPAIVAAPSLMRVSTMPELSGFREVTLNGVPIQFDTIMVDLGPRLYFVDGSKFRYWAASGGEMSWDEAIAAGETTHAVSRRIS